MLVLCTLIDDLGDEVTNEVVSLDNCRGVRYQGKTRHNLKLETQLDFTIIWLKFKNSNLTDLLGTLPDAFLNLH